MIDVITCGETMIRLTAPSNKRLQQSTQLEVHIGGSESNVAVGLARLGLKVAWLSRLTQNSLGELIVQAIAANGVDTSHIVWTTEQRNGLYFHEEGVGPRPGRVIYDRKDSAFCYFEPNELPDDLFSEGSAKLFHTSGISLAVSKQSRSTINIAIDRAKASHTKISFDLNYRAKLWSRDEARSVCEPYLAEADICFIPLRDAISVLQIKQESSTESVTPHAAMKALRERYSRPTIVMTDGERGAWASNQTEIIHHPAFVVPNPIGRLGGGDAFAAGFLKKYLLNSPLDQSLAFACAAASLKYTQSGDIPCYCEAEIDQLLKEGNRGVER